MSEIDGRKVSDRGKSDWVGIVQGDASLPGHVRVDWREPRSSTGIHRPMHLVVLDEPPTQEELAKML